MNSQNHREQLLPIITRSLLRAAELPRPSHEDSLPQPPPVSIIALPPHPWQMAAAPLETFSPITLGAYHSPLEVIGFLHSAGDRLSIRLADARGDVIARRALQLSPGKAGFFHTYLRFETRLEQNATLEVSERNADDGSETQHMRMPLTILPGQRYLDLAAPAVGASLAGPIVVSGYSNTFEANVVVELSYREGEYLLRQPTMGGSYGFYRDFQVTLEVTTPQVARAALISAYELDPGSGACIDQTRVPVTILPASSLICS